MAIIANKAKCKRCFSVIESRHRHDFVWCKCGAIAVDGGTSYIRRIGTPGDLEELSEYTKEEE